MNCNIAKKLNVKRLIAGVDEAGRGPLAGSVVAAAVILPKKYSLPGLKDSKQLNAKQRNVLFNLIHQTAIAVSVGSASVKEINQINIFHASLLAMQRAILALKVIPHLTLIDGKHCPPIENYLLKSIVRGDETEPVISAASIIAKVTRDREMCQLHEKMPQYGFAQHKGYTTKQHLAALKKYGPSEVHRAFFAPVAAMNPEIEKV